MNKEKKTNLIVVLCAVAAIAIIAVATVFAIKTKNAKNASVEAEATGYTYEEPSSMLDDLFSTTAEMITETLSDLPEPPQTTRKAVKQTKPASVEVSEMQEQATVPTLEEEDLEKGKTKSVAVANTDLPDDMSLAGLSRSGYNVVGLKEYIYNNDMDPNCSQRKFGYNKLYDWGAQLIDFSIDTKRMKFNYDGKDYMIQIWKGQYISGEIGTVGGEVGIYTRPEGKSAANSHYNCAGTDDELYMELTIFWDEAGDGNFLPQLTRNYGRHWWETGYVDGQLANIKDSTPLRLLSHITFKDEEQAIGFENALIENGFAKSEKFNPLAPNTFRRDGKDVIYIWQ